MKSSTHLRQLILLSGMILLKTVSYAGWTIDSLANYRTGMLSVNVNSKAVFTNGASWDIYDFASGNWSSGNFVMARTAMKMVANGGKVYIAGGWRGPYTNPVDVNNVEIYNDNTSSWSLLKLSQARTVGAAAAVGSKVILAGGYRVLAYSAKVDVFDVNTNVRTTAVLSQARTNIAVGVSGSKVVFAGGQKGQATMGVINSSDVVDIYDDNSGLWSTALLSSKRQDIAVAVCGGKILFAGGINMGNGRVSGQVDIYDAVNGSWTVATLSQPKYAMTPAVVGNKAYFFGGVVNGSGLLSQRVEIYDAVTGVWSVKYLGGQHHAGVIGLTPRRLMFAGGIDTWGNTGTSRIDVLDLQNGQWSIEQLSQPRISLSSASYQTTAIFAGGNQYTSSYPLYTIPSKRIDRWNDNVPGPALVNKTGNLLQEKMRVYPNPFNEVLYIDINAASGEIMTADVFDLSGKRICSGQFEGGIYRMDMEFVPAGMYLLQVRGNDNSVRTSRIIKQ